MDHENPSFRYFPVSAIEEIHPDERLYVEIGELNIVIFNVGSQYYALEDTCSHDNGPIGDGEIEGKEVICPRHGARFNIENGKALTMPAVKDIRYFPVRINEGKIEIGIPN